MENSLLDEGNETVEPNLISQKTEIRITSGLDDWLNTIKSLTYSGYHVETDIVYKYYPRERTIDYFSIIYYPKERK